MAIQTVNTGTTPNDGTGDPARTSFTKINDNFTTAENAASRLVATNAQALAGTAGVLPDAEQVRRNHVAQVATIADLRALVPAFEEQAVNLSSYHDLPAPMSPLGGGVFIARFGDYSTEVASDTLTGVYVAFPSDPTGASGAWVRKLEGYVTPQMFGAIGDSVTDDTVAIQSAIDSRAPLGGVVFAPEGQYKTTAPILMKTGVSLIGEGYWNSSSTFREGVTSILAHHNGAAMLSLKGAIGCTVSNIALEGSQTAKPKTGILLGRDTAASAGFHTIQKVSICGWYTVAAIYSIASEDNYWEDIITWNFGGDALYGLVTSTQDIFAVDSLVESTNLTNTFVQLKIIVTSPSASSAGIYLEGAEAMGSWNFFGCYITQYAGAYICINNGAIDGAGMFGPITLVGVSGEPLAGGDPLIGIDLTAPVPVNFRGLTITGSRFQLYAGANHNDIRQSPNVTLLQPNIVIQPPEAFPYALSEIHYDKVKGGVVSVGRSYEWTPVILNAGWSDAFGAPYAAAGYRISPTGRVSLRGTIDGGSGTAFTLPAGYRPAADMLFPVFTNGGVLGRILVTAGGDVSRQAGNITNIDLTTIQFDVT